MQLRIILLALLVLPLASASAIILDSTGQEACATDQLVISGILQNAKSVADKYDLSVTSKDGLSAFVTPSLEVDAYGIARFDLFLSPVCLDAGSYDYEITAGSVRGEVVSEKGSIQINSCELMELRISQTKTEVCNGESASFAISVKNLGNEEQNFTLGTDLEAGTYTLSKDKFLLRPGAEGKATLNLNIPANLYAQGMLTFKVRSESTYSCGSNSREVQASINVRRCDGAKLTALQDLQVQANTKSVWNVFIDNQKTPDSYGLVLECADFAALPVERVELGELESANINIPIAPRLEDVGEYECRLTATSEKFSKSYTTNLKLKVVQEYAVKLEAPSQIKVCMGDDALIKVKLLNAGKANKYALAAPGGEVALSTGEINAAENSTNEFGLAIKGNALDAGVNTVEVAVRSPYAAAKSSTRIIVEDCYNSALSVSPRTIEMCAGNGGDNVVVRAVNKGTREDSYVLFVASKPGFDTQFSSQEAFRLGPGESKEIELKVNAKEDAKSGNYEIEVNSRGTNSEESASFSVNVLPVSVCHSLKLEVDGNSRRTGSGIGKSFRISITNNGRFKERAELILKEKPAWAYITPSFIEVLPGTKEEALIYFAPPLNEALGNYPIVVEARGKYLEQTLGLNVEVIALEGGEGQEAKIDLSNVKIPTDLERETETPIEIDIYNSGDVDLHNASILFSEAVSIVGQKPFDVEAGQRKKIALVVTIGKEAPEDVMKIKLGVYAAEGSAEKEVTIKAVESRLDVAQKESREAEGGFDIALALKNNGEEALKLKAHSLENANYSETEIGLQPGEEKEIRVKLQEGRETLVFEDELSGKIYRKRIEVSETGDITGLFVASMGRVLPFLVAIIAGAIALYLIVSRRGKIAERLDGKKGELEGEDEKGPEFYEESESEPDVAEEKREEAEENTALDRKGEGDGIDEGADGLEDDIDRHHIFSAVAAGKKATVRKKAPAAAEKKEASKEGNKKTIGKMKQKPLVKSRKASKQSAGGGRKNASTQTEGRSPHPMQDYHIYSGPEARWHTNQ